MVDFSGKQMWSVFEKYFSWNTLASLCIFILISTCRHLLVRCFLLFLYGRKGEIFFRIVLWLICALDLCLLCKLTFLFTVFYFMLAVMDVSIKAHLHTSTIGRVNLIYTTCI